MTLLAFTDGLVERRGETIDGGLERLGARVSYDCGPPTTCSGQSSASSTNKEPMTPQRSQQSNG